MKNRLRKRKFFPEDNNSSDEGTFKSLDLIEMRNIQRETTETMTKKHHLVATTYHQSPCSMILEGNFVDIHDIDSLEPSDLGLHDIPYIDDD